MKIAQINMLESIN